jgi:squalene synthase HpnC
MMRAASLEVSPPEIPAERAVMGRVHGENFPVAARVLSRAHRRHLLAVYGFARLADELGDELGAAASPRSGARATVAGERLAALDWLEGELDRAYAGNARHPLLVRLQETLRECRLPRDPFVRLIDANRLDQRVARYDTWEQLQAYCELSATPVGELVLRVFGLATPERISQSDRVCTALQLVEHVQDVGEDARRGRIYLPAEDLVCFGSSHEQLIELFSRTDEGLDLRGAPDGASTPGARLRRTWEHAGEALAFEATRARELLAAGVPLVRSVPGRPKLAVGAFVAGGYAALEEIERAAFDVLGGVRRASRRRRVGALWRVLAESRT